jgi:hypothetical protein
MLGDDFIRSSVTECPFITLPEEGSLQRMFANPDWPVILTNADWQKKKGVVAKIAGETGIGEAMTAAQTEFNKINWKSFAATDLLPADRHSNSGLLKKRQAALAYHGKTVEPVRTKLKALNTLAKAVAEKWKKNKLIPAGSVKTVEAVATAANNLSIDLMNNSINFTEAWKSYDDVIENNKKKAAIEINKIKTTIGNLESAITEYIKNPTKKAWADGNTSVHQRCRSMCNTIRAVEELDAKYWTTWQPFGDFYNKDAPDNNPEEEKKIMTQKVRTVVTALKDFKANYQNLLPA